MLTRARRWLAEPIDGASVAFLRFVFGATVCFEALRHLATGRARELFVEPEFYFSYPGLAWVKPWAGSGPYLHFGLLAVAGTALALGHGYRLAAVATLAGLSTWFVWDASRYENHPYLFVLFAFLFVWMPAGRAWSQCVPRWVLCLLRFQLALPYVFGGIAKLNADWLSGQPMTLWLAERATLPWLGGLLDSPDAIATAGLAASYLGLLIDLAVVPALLWKPTRVPAFVVCLLFHVANAYLFEIGVFPWFMIAATPIFFAPDWPRRFRPASRPTFASTGGPAPRLSVVASLSLALWVALQLAVPLRSQFVEEDPSWTERGHRFAWRMKLREKRGSVHFFTIDRATGASQTLDPTRYLTEKQVAHMATQPHLIEQFARLVADRELAQGHDVEVHAEIVMSLNGRPPRALVDPAWDLAVAR